MTAEAYEVRHLAAIEQALQFAVHTAIREQAEAPLEFIGRQLLEQAEREASSKCTEHDSNMLWAVKQAVEKKKERRCRSPSREGHSVTSETVPESSAHDWGEFELRSWLESLNLSEAIEKALCSPLEEVFRDESGRSELDEGAPASAPMADGAGADDQEEIKKLFLTSLGEHSSHEHIARVLHERKLTDEIAKAIWENARQMSSSDDDAVPVGDARATLQSKFFEDDRALKFGDVATFYHGLDGFLGPPNPNLFESMENEHMRQEDSNKLFKAPNYKTQTTPQIEFWFVADPSDAKLRMLKLNEWPHEPLASNDEPFKFARQALHPEHFEAELGDRNSRLRDLQMAPLVDEEFIAARLYTGPMYSKVRNHGTFLSTLMPVLLPYLFARLICVRICANDLDSTTLCFVISVR